jgi:hypothetical protein
VTGQKPSNNPSPISFFFFLCLIFRSKDACVIELTPRSDQSPPRGSGDSDRDAKLHQVRVICFIGTHASSGDSSLSALVGLISAFR